MIRHWGQIMVLVLVVLVQMACPRHAAKQTNDEASSPMTQPRERGM
jgi:hypothetical protein